MKSKKEKLRESRLAICEKCPHLYKDPILGTRWCSLCTCNLYIKAGMKSKHCADNPPKW